MMAHPMGEVPVTVMGFLGHEDCPTFEAACKSASLQDEASLIYQNIVKGLHRDTIRTFVSHYSLGKSTRSIVKLHKLIEKHRQMALLMTGEEPVPLVLDEKSHVEMTRRMKELESWNEGIIRLYMRLPDQFRRFVQMDEEFDVALPNPDIILNLLKNEYNFGDNLGYFLEVVDDLDEADLRFLVDRGLHNDPELSQHIEMRQLRRTDPVFEGRFRVLYASVVGIDAGTVSQEHLLKMLCSAHDNEAVRFIYTMLYHYNSRGIGVTDETVDRLIELVVGVPEEAFEECLDYMITYASESPNGLLHYFEERGQM